MFNVASRASAPPAGSGLEAHHDTDIPSISRPGARGACPPHSHRAGAGLYSRQPGSGALLELLAEQSCWSRWQLQRVFLHETGQTVAHYVRELKLSQAAEALLSTRQRVLDLALSHGFGSEVSFSRAFKQQFGCSPLAYRKRGLRLGLRTPLVRAAALPTRPGWCRCGSRASPASPCTASGEILGLFAKARLPADGARHLACPAEAGGLCPSREWLGWWTSRGRGRGLPLLGRDGGRGGDTAARSVAPRGAGPGYAVLTHLGPIEQLGQSLNWFIQHWLPGSSYRGWMASSWSAIPRFRRQAAGRPHGVLVAHRPLRGLDRLLLPPSCRASSVCAPGPKAYQAETDDHLNPPVPPVADGCCRLRLTSS